jgi:hypothetical protein
MGTYVGKWDCPLCGTKRIPGWKDGRTVELCPACGGPTTGKWYLDNRDMVIADAAEIAEAKSKRAWKCGHCGKVNDGKDHDCDACGNARDASTDDQQFISREYAPENVPATSEDTEDPNVESVTDRPAETQEGFSRSSRERISAEAEFKRKRRLKWLKIGGIALGGVLFILFLLLWKKEIPVTVVGFSWERTVDIEVYGPHSESSWSTPPSGAYGVSTSWEIHHYNTVVVGRECHTETRSVVCGTTDNGNGTFSDRYCDETSEVCEDQTVQEPVYATKYYYTIDRWGFDHTEKAGQPNHEPYWPTYAATQSQADKYREAAKGETYTVKVMRTSGKLNSSTVPLARWQAMRGGQQLTGYRNMLFGYWMGLKD